jgi:predicted phosphodiesterase
MSTILVIPDMHIPYNIPGMCEFLKDIKKEAKPDHVVFLGDVVDQYAFSRFNKDPDAMTATQELMAARSELAVLYKIFPKIKMCIGNHEARLYKRAQDVGIPFSFLRTIKELLQSPDGWDIAESHVVDGILFTHGDGASGRAAIAKLIERYRSPIVIGHLHAQATIMHLNNGMKRTWAMICGSLVDPNSIAMGYGKTCIDKPILTVGLIVDGNPNIIPFQ